MADNEAKAMQLMAEAEKKLTSSKGFFGQLFGQLFGGSSKVEEAVECYQRAANMFKMAKKWGQAGNAFCEAAALHGKAGSRHDAATNFVDAANCYKKSDPNEAVNCLLKAIEIYTEMGFTMAAKHHQTIAEMYETEAVDLDRAVQLIPTNGYDLEVRTVLSEKSRHIDELVQRQRVQPSRRRGTGRRLCRRRTALAPPPTAHRPNQGSTYRNTNYDQKDHSRNGYHNSNDRADRMVDQRGDSVYPRLSDSSISFNNTREVKYIPAETLDDFDEEYEDEFEDDSEEELFHQVEEQYKDLHCNGKIGSLSQSPLQSEEVSAVGDTAVVSSKDKDFDGNAYTPEDDCTSISTKMINNFRQILNQYPEGIWATELQNLYQNQYGVQFNLHDLGFNNVISLVAALPSVFSYRREGTHDWKLYDARYVTQESLEAKGEIVFPESEKYIPQTIIDNIKKMLKAHNGGFRSTDLLDLYLETYNKHLKLEVLGLSMDEFVNLLRNDVTVMEYKNYYVLLPKHERLPCEAIEPATPDERLKLPGGTLIVPIPDAVLKLGEEIPAQDMPAIQQSGDDPLWELEVRVTEVMSPVYFYMILGSTFEEMENMMDDLEKFYQLEEESLKIPPPYIAENLYCVAKYLDHWHRVKIVKVNSYDMIEIEYIDYGTPGKINCLELRYLSTNFAKFPAQAICAKLIGVKPKNGMTKFPDEVCNEFLRIVSEKRLVAHVYQVTEKVRHKKERVQMEVILFDVENPEGELVINDYLINRGLASPIPTETETEDSPVGDLLPDGNILLESDPTQITGDIPLENYFPQVNGVLPPLLPSGSTSLLGDVASPLGNSSALLPASSVNLSKKCSSTLKSRARFTLRFRNESKLVINRHFSSTFSFSKESSEKDSDKKQILSSTSHIVKRESNISENGSKQNNTETKESVDVSLVIEQMRKKRKQNLFVLPQVLNSKGSELNLSSEENTNCVAPSCRLSTNGLRLNGTCSPIGKSSVTSIQLNNVEVIKSNGHSNGSINGHDEALNGANLSDDSFVDPTESCSTRSEANVLTVDSNSNKAKLEKKVEEVDVLAIIHKIKSKRNIFQKPPSPR